MSNVEALNEMHIPQSLKARIQKTNDMIVRKANHRITAISGDTFNAGGTYEVQIQSSNNVLPKSIRVHGKITQNGAYTGDAKLQNGISSVFSQAQVAYNQRNMVNINKHAQYVAYTHMNSNYTQEEQKWENEMQLVDKVLARNVAQDFSMPLDIYGLDMPYLVPTGSGNKLTVRLVLDDVKNVLFGALAQGGDPVAPLVANYAITELYLSADFYTLTPSADAVVREALESETGASYPLLAYDVLSTNLPASTTQNLLLPQTYRNVVTNVYIPKLSLDVNIAAEGQPAEANLNASGIPTNNPFTLLKFNTGDSLPDKAIVEFSGAEPVNINSNNGQTGKAQHLQSLINLSRKSLEDRVSGYGWASSLYDGRGVFGASWLRGDEKMPEILNSGYNGYLANGQCNVQFNLAAAPNADTKLLTVVNFTRVITVSKSGASSQE